MRTKVNRFATKLRNVALRPAAEKTENKLKTGTKTSERF